MYNLTLLEASSNGASISEILQGATTFFSTVMAQVGTIAKTITDTPLLMVGVSVTLASIFIGFFTKLMRR